MVALLSKAEAIASNFPKYFTGKTCKNGHVCERYTVKSTCVECAKDRAEKQRLSDPEGARSYYRRYREQNRDGLLEKGREAYQARKEDYAPQRLEYRKANSERLAAKGRDYYAENKEAINARVKERRPKFLGRDNHLSRLKKARKIRATPPWADLKKIKNIYEQAAKLKFHVDHVIPLRHPLVCGLHVEANLQVLNPKGNMRKHNKFTID